MSTVQTIRGPIDSSQLGRTLSHEHLTNGTSGMERIPGLLKRDEMEGFAGQISLGHDASPAGLWGRWRTERNADCWTLVPKQEVGWLRENGATEEQIDASLRGSVRSTFEAAAAMVIQTPRTMR